MNTAIVGLSDRIEQLLAAMAQTDELRCTAICSRDKKQAQRIAKAYHLNVISNGIQKLLQQKEIALLYIAAADRDYFSYIYKSLQAGKHVIYEKGLFLTVKEHRLLEQYARSHKLFLFEDISIPHLPNYLTLQSSLDMLGAVRMIQCNFSKRSCHSLPISAKELFGTPSFSFWESALTDVNFYNLYFVISLFGKPLQASYFPNCPSNGADTSGVALLDYGEFKAVCIGCKDSSSHCLTQLQGEKGYLCVNADICRCTTLVATHDGFSEELTVTQNENPLVHELRRIAAFIKEHRLEECYRLLKISRQSAAVCEQLYQQDHRFYKTGWFTAKGSQ